ncbi:hypothetical protein [Schlesneria paludicola]|uniref:hypothetical protein n=1 Tax=Schlesneria paludicola TaxID=360056 RepID=UPI00029AE12B|nr:hypothetical protein [Schlesneria paludicola]
MANQEWRDRLHEELNKRKLPPSYSARLIEEFTDHLTDLQEVSPNMEAVKSAEAKLGTPESLAAAAEREYLKRTFSGRHPILTFLFLPIPVVAITSVVMIYLLFRCQYEFTPTYPAHLEKPTMFEWFMAYGCMYFSRFLPFAVTALLFMSVGRRARRPGWGVLACVLVAGFAFLFHVMVVMPNEQHNLVVALTFGPQDSEGLLFWLVNSVERDSDRLIQAIVPIAIGVCGFIRLPRSIWLRLDNVISPMGPATTSL